MSSMEVIDRIKTAESEGEKLRQEALEEARRILNEAEEEAEVLGARLHKEAIDRGSHLMKEAETEAHREIESLKSTNKAKVDILSARAEKNLQEAVSFILGRIVNSHGSN